MKVLVAVKRAIDYTLRPRLMADGSAVDLSKVKMSMNPFDEIAVEEAVRMKEGGLAAEILAVSCGPAACRETLQTALALGADRAFLIAHDGELQPLAVAKLLAALVRRESPDLVLLGKQAIDDDAAQTGQMLAALLGWPQATCASRIVLLPGQAHVTREVDGGTETLEMRLPAVVTTDLRLNQPRYVTLPNIMKARKKSLETLAAEELVSDVRPRIKLLKVAEPPQRKPGVRVADVASLLDKLKNEAKVL